MKPRIGVSACFFHADPQRAIFKGKTLLYAEESMLAWIMSGGALPVMLPRPAFGVTIEDLVDSVDGLVLQGGSDMAPEHYGEEPARPEWSGDARRDQYEMQLVRAFLARNKPLLGVCRGAQVLNVTLGGTLFQDIETLHPGRRVHRNWEVYDQHAHELAIEPGSALARWYAGAARPPLVNSVHHQGLNRLGKRAHRRGALGPRRRRRGGAARRRHGRFAYGVAVAPRVHLQYAAPRPTARGC